VDTYAEPGQAPQRVAVEMRGLKMEGFIREGDTVRIPAGRLKNGIRKPEKVENLTTSSWVRVQGERQATVISLVLLTVLGIAVTVGVVQFNAYRDNVELGAEHGRREMDKEWDNMELEFQRNRHEMKEQSDSIFRQMELERKKYIK